MKNLHRDLDRAEYREATPWVPTTGESYDGPEFWRTCALLTKDGKRAGWEVIGMKQELDLDRGEMYDIDVHWDNIEEGLKENWEEDIKIREVFKTKKEAMSFMRAQGPTKRWNSAADSGNWWDDLCFDPRGCYLSDGVYIK